jgi:hypothetical protein
MYIYKPFKEKLEVTLVSSFHKSASSLLGVKKNIYLYNICIIG